MTRFTFLPRPRWRGFSFALHLLRVQGFYFVPLQCSKIQAFTAAFVPSMQVYTANTAKQRTGLYRRFSCGLSHFTAADARPAQAAIYHLRHARAYHSAVAPPTRARYHSRAGTLDRPAQTAYYNKVYKSAETHLLWIHARQCSISQTMQARRVLFLPPVDRWQVLTRYQQHKPGAPAEGSASPPVQGQPGGVSMLLAPGGFRSGTGQQSGRTGSVWHPLPGGAVQ